ncbi:MAG: HD domain-containing phosphohydrolase [Pirellulales bacterium]
MRILIVDDSEIALELLQRTLVKAGHTVDTASNGEEALEWVRKGVHRLIVSDWEMPGMNGLELCRKVRALSTTYVYFILVTSHNTTADIVTGLSAGADDFISKPFNPPELLVRVRAGERVLSLESREIAIFAMANLTESRDQETGQHLERVRCYAQLLARRLMDYPKYRGKIDDKFVRLVYETSPLHDIGKVAIPDNILKKPGKLTDEEFAIMRTHTTVGKAQLDLALAKYPDAEFLRFARDIVACHHERFDGTGYPVGLAGEEIPLCARIVAVADVYDALTSDRVYRAALPHEEAKRMIMKSSGSHFDPDIIDGFVELADQFEAIHHALADGSAEQAPLARIDPVVSPAVQLATA